MTTTPRLGILLALATTSISAQGTRSDYERARMLRARFEGKVFRDRIDPHWLDGGSRFW